MNLKEKPNTKLEENGTHLNVYNGNKCREEYEKPQEKQIKPSLIMGITSSTEIKQL